MKPETQNDDVVTNQGTTNLYEIAQVQMLPSEPEPEQRAYKYVLQQ